MMKASIDLVNTGLLSSAIEFDGDLSLSSARALLKIQFSAARQGRMRDLLTKSRGGTLSSSEEAEMDLYGKVSCLLDVIHSKARQALKKRRSAS